MKGVSEDSDETLVFCVVWAEVDGAGDVALLGCPNYEDEFLVVHKCSPDGVPFLGAVTYLYADSSQFFRP